MGTIEEIINAIDDELIEKDKLYLELSQINKVLLRKGLISVAEKRHHTLKKILEQNLIQHAYQTKEKPKQWRIPLSEIGVEKINKNKKSSINYCPFCGTPISNSIKFSSGSNQSCTSCGELISFTNSNQTNLGLKETIVKTKQNKSKDKDSLTKSIPYVIVAVVFLIWLALDEAGFKFNNLFEYTPTTYITQSGYMGAYTEESLDKFTEYAVHKDYRAVERLISYGDIFKIPSGLEVYVVETNFSKVKIRLGGETDEIWTVIEAIKKKR